MQPVRASAATVLALAAVLGLVGCGAGGSAAPSTASAPSSSSSVDAGVIDACALVPTAELTAVLGAEPGPGVPSKGRIDGGGCTWKAGAHTAIAQATRQPDAYLPASVYRRPKSGAAVPGADRGWASAERHTIVVVRHGRGLLFTDVDLGTARQADYDALAAAIAAKL